MTAEAVLISIPANTKCRQIQFQISIVQHHPKLGAWLLPQKMLSHWNFLLHSGICSIICSIFPKGNEGEYDKIRCHEKNKGQPGKTENSED